VFIFPKGTATTDGVVPITDISQLTRHFHGWSRQELPERSPIVGIVHDGEVVSADEGSARA